MVLIYLGQKSPKEIIEACKNLEKGEYRTFKLSEEVSYKDKRRLITKLTAKGMMVTIDTSNSVTVFKRSIRARPFWTELNIRRINPWRWVCDHLRRSA